METGSYLVFIAAPFLSSPSATVAEMLGANRSHITRVKTGEHEFTDAQLEQIERSLSIPLGLLLLGAPPSQNAPAKVRQLHKQAAQLLAKSAAFRGMR
jgi:hypothetical protein